MIHYSLDMTDGWSGDIFKCLKTAWCVYLCIKFCEEVKVLFEVSGQNSLNDKEAESLELHVFKVDQEVVLGSRHEEVPSCSCVMVFQD